MQLPGFWGVNMEFGSRESSLTFWESDTEQKTLRWLETFNQVTWTWRVNTATTRCQAYIVAAEGSWFLDIQSVHIVLEQTK